MKKYKEGKTIKKILDSIICDNCNQVIDPDSEFIEVKNFTSTGTWYFHVADTECNDYCSIECLSKQLYELDMLNTVTSDVECLSKQLYELDMLNTVISDEEFESFNITIKNKAGD